MSACDSSPRPKSQTTTNAQATPRVEAQAFNGQAYRTQDGRSAITLISSDELEYRTPDGTTLLCKYKNQENAIRVIVTAFGTQQVLYFQRVPLGLLGNDGKLFLSPSGLVEARRQEELAERARLEAKAQADRAEAEREELRRAEAEKLAKRIQEAKSPKNVILTVNTPPDNVWGNTTQIKLTDVDIELGVNGRPGSKIWFGDLESVTERDRLLIYVSIRRSGGSSYSFPAGAKRDEFLSAVMQAVKDWRARYPDLATRIE